MTSPTMQDAAAEGRGITLAKLRRLFDVSPCLKDSDNIVHLPVPSPDWDGKSRKYEDMNLPGVTWKELYELIARPEANP